MLLSSPRSGSTLLRAMLARHPALFAPPEPHLLPFESMGARRDAISERSLGTGLQQALTQLYGLGDGEADGFVRELEEADAPVSQVYGLLKERLGDRLLLDKSPWYAQDDDVLRRAESLFDTPRYLHLVRHPYAVIDSIVRNGFEAHLDARGANAHAKAEKAWAAINANVADFCEEIDPERHHVVRYEDLVQDPAAVMTRVCAFLGIPYDDAVLRPYEGNGKADAAPDSIAFGDPRFHLHRGIDAELGDSWRRVELPRPLGGFAKRVAVELGYELPNGVSQMPATDGASAPATTEQVAPEPPADPCLVPIQPIGPKNPLYLVGPGGGVVHPYYRLGYLLEPDQPLYGLQQAGLDEEGKSLDRMEDLAARYVEAIRGFQPEGPYRVGGWSFGGMVAYEMARQLKDAGQEVDLLVVFDTYAKPRDGKASFGLVYKPLALLSNLKVGFSLMRQTLPYIRDALYLMFGQGRKARDGETGPRPGPIEYLRWAWADMIRNHFLKEANVADVVKSNSRLLLIQQPTLRKALSVMTANLRALRRYRPGAYPGRLTLIRAEQQLVVRQYYKDPLLGWGDLAEGGVDVHTISGNHAALLSPPFVDELAEKLTACLREIN